MGIHAAGTQHGLAYHMAPLEGKRAPVLIALQSRAAAAHVQFQPLQQLIWQIMGGQSYSELPPQSQQLVDQLIPEYRQALSEDSVVALQKRLNLIRNSPLGKISGIEIGTHDLEAMIQRYQQIQQNLHQYANNYEAMARQFVDVIPGTAQNAGPSSWSRVNPRVYVRLADGNFYGQIDHLQIRVLPSNARAAGAPQRSGDVESASYKLTGSDPQSTGGSDLADVPIEASLAYPNGQNMQGLGWTPVSVNPPVITNVSTILPHQNQTITIIGSGFGTQPPYNGDSPYIQFGDLTGNWNAGYPGNLVTLDVQSWTDTQIVLGGFSGQSGMLGTNWTLEPGDQVQIKVWNAPGGAGPATYASIVVKPSSCTQTQTGPSTNGGITPGNIPLGPGELSLYSIPNLSESPFSRGAFVVAVQVRDCSGSPLQSGPISLWVTPGSGRLEKSTLMPDTHGVAYTTLTLAPISSFVQGPFSVCSGESVPTQGCGYTTVSFSPTTITAEVSGVTASVTVSASNELVSTPAGSTPSSWWTALGAPVAFGVGYANGFAQPNNPQSPWQSLCHTGVPVASALITGANCAITVATGLCPATGVTCPIAIAGEIATGGSAPFECAFGILHALGVPTPPTSVVGVAVTASEVACDVYLPSQITITPVASNSIDLSSENKLLTARVLAFDKYCQAVQAYVFLRFYGNGQAALSGTALGLTPQLFLIIPPAGAVIQYTSAATQQPDSGTLIASLGADGSTAMPGSASYSFGSGTTSGTISSACPAGPVSTSSPYPSHTLKPGGITPKPPAMQLPPSTRRPAPSSNTIAAPTQRAATSLKLSISAISPSHGPAGTAITIGGMDFNNVTAVTFGGTPATFTRISQTSIKATVPDVSYADSTIKTLGPGSQVGVTVTVKTASASANSLFNYTGPR